MSATARDRIASVLEGASVLSLVFSLSAAAGVGGIAYQAGHGFWLALAAAVGVGSSGFAVSLALGQAAGYLSPTAALAAIHGDRVPAPEGYIVLTRCPDGGWCDDWDGKLHAELADARAAYGEALEYGEEPVVVRFSPITTSQPSGDGRPLDAARATALGRERITAIDDRT